MKYQMIFFFILSTQENITLLKSILQKVFAELGILLFGLSSILIYFHRSHIMGIHQSIMNFNIYMPSHFIIEYLSCRLSSNRYSKFNYVF